MPTVELRAGGSKITDDGLRHLAGLEQLIALSLRGTAITDAGAAEVLATLPALEQVDIASDELTGEFVKGWPSLRTSTCWASGPGAAWRGVQHFCRHPRSLESLRTRSRSERPGRTRRGPVVKSFPNLQMMHIGESDTLLDDERMLAVHHAFPGVEVNGLTLSAKAVEKYARKRGLELPGAGA